MRKFERFAILIPVVSIVSVLAVAAQAEDPSKGGSKAGPQRGAGPAMHQGPARVGGGPTGPGIGPRVGGGPGGPGAGPRMGPGPGRMARGPMPSHNFGGRPYHGSLAWEGGRWHHAVRNGRDGWWWDVGGAWYFYPEMVEGPPAYVSDYEYEADVMPMPLTDRRPALTRRRRSQPIRHLRRRRIRPRARSAARSSAACSAVS